MLVTIKDLVHVLMIALDMANAALALRIIVTIMRVYQDVSFPKKRRQHMTGVSKTWQGIMD